MEIENSKSITFWAKNNTLKSDLLEDGNYWIENDSGNLWIVKIRPLGGWKVNFSIVLTDFFEFVKIRPLGGWKVQ